MFDAIRILVDKKPDIDQDKWIRLIESRRERMSRHFDSSTLHELGQELWMVSDPSNWFHHQLRKDVSEVQGEGFSIKTQGIFQFQNPWNEEAGEEVSDINSGIMVIKGVRRAWGLTRSNQWVLVEVEFVRDFAGGYKGREKATSVSVVQMELSEILKKTKFPPKKIYDRLEEIIKSWYETRERSYHEMKRLFEDMRVENSILGLFR